MEGSLLSTKEKLLQDEVHAFNALLDEEKFDREQQLMSSLATRRKSAAGTLRTSSIHLNSTVKQVCCLNPQVFPEFSLQLWKCTGRRPHQTMTAPVVIAMAVTGIPVIPAVSTA